MDRSDLERRYRERLAALTAAAQALESEIWDALSGAEHIDRVSFRAKGVKSFVDKVLTGKVNPPYDDPLVEVEDQIAGRVLVFFRSDITIVHERLSSVLTFVESTRREPAKDVEFGYESHHLVCSIPPQVKPNEWRQVADMPNTFELQIRTLCMHAWAEPQHDVGYKLTQELSRDDQRELAWIAASMWGADQAFERIIRRRLLPPGG